MTKCIAPHFGRSLRLFRRKSQLTQESLANRTQLDRSYISLLERGKRKPTLECLMLLADALNITTVEFVLEIEAQLHSEAAMKARALNPN